MTVGSVAWVLVGCGEDHIGSSALKTSGMYADFEARCNGENTTVNAMLRAENDKGDIVNLEAGDALLAGIDDEIPRRLSADSKEEHYLETFDDVSAGGTRVTLDFERDDGKDATNSHVTLPEPFTLTLDVSASDRVPRGQHVVATWEPAGNGGTIFWWLDGDCIWSENSTTEDDGQFTLTEKAFEELKTHKGESCKVTFRLERHNTGKVDEAFRGGRFLGVQTRSKSFISAPAPEADDEGTGGSENTETGGSGNTETGGSTNEGGAQTTETGGSSTSTGGTGTGGAVEEEAGAGGQGTGGSTSSGGSAEPSAGAAGTAAGSTSAAGQGGGGSEG